MSRLSPEADVAFISELADLLERKALAEITVKREYADNDSLEVRVVRLTMSASPQPAQAQVATTAEMPPPQPPVASAPQSSLPEDPSQHPGAVTSPMVGTAYLAPEPGAAPFVSLGAEVSEGQTLLIIEAMKTMNHIAAPRSGTVRRILIEDATPVEYGAPLMIIE